jgi:hypothetical protein
MTLAMLTPNRFREVDLLMQSHCRAFQERHGAHAVASANNALESSILGTRLLPEVQWRPICGQPPTKPGHYR